jgi:hypothetical protein
MLVAFRPNPWLHSILALAQYARAADGCHDRVHAMQAQAARGSLQRRQKPSAVPSTVRGNVAEVFGPSAFSF